MSIFTVKNEKKGVNKKPEAPDDSIRMSEPRVGFMKNVVLLLYKFAVYIEILERNVFRTVYLISIFCYIVEVAVF